MRIGRRRFLASTLGAGASLALARNLTAQEPAMTVSDKDPVFRISLAQWSLHRMLLSRELDNLDFVGVARGGFDIEAVEYVNVFFIDKAADFTYLGEMKKRAEDHGVRSLLIMIDNEGDLADADDSGRRRAIENHFKWVAAACFLGCHSIRVNARGTGTWGEQRDRAADSLNRLATLAEPYDVDVIVENHGGLSSNGKWLAEVMGKADHPRVGTLPDFGNFHIRGDEWYDRYRGVAELMPWARGVSAKSHEFDDEGEEVRTDYHRMLKVVVAAGYHGYVGIEWEGEEPSESEGILLTKGLLERVREELS